MAVPKLPRIKIPGLTKFNDALEKWASSIESAFGVRGQWPVMVDQTPTGNLIKIADSGSGPRIMVVTTDIGAMSGDDTGEGQAVDAEYDSATKKLTAGTGESETIRNSHEKAFLEGGIIAVFPQYGEWWAFDVNRCDHYS